jgi:predicted peptidase
VKRIFLVFLLGAIINFGLITHVGASDLMPKDELGEKYIEQRDAFSYNGVTLQYMLIFPAGYSRIDRPWPMILFLHGGTARGQNLDLVKTYGPPLLAEEQADFSFVVLAPQCPDGEYWTTKADILAALLDNIIKKYQIDPERVYLTGTSMGGNGTWNLVARRPEYFAAVAPMAASPEIPDIWHERFISMPIWAFHGDQDTICPLKDDEAMINALREQGASPRFTVFPGKGHYIGKEAYQNSDLYDWFLANIRRN